MYSRASRDPTSTYYTRMQWEYDSLYSTGATYLSMVSIGIPWFTATEVVFGIICLPLLALNSHRDVVFDIHSR